MVQFCQVVENRYVTFAEHGVNLGLHRQFARLMRVVRSIFVAGSGHIGQGLEKWPCQLAFGIWVASQMPNQVDRGVVFFTRQRRGLWFLLREVSTWVCQDSFVNLWWSRSSELGHRLKIVSD